MRTDIESLWVFALASKCKSLISPNTNICLLCLVVLPFLVINFVYWAHPGGPAWGRHKWSRNPSRDLRINPIPGPKGLPIIGSMSLMSGLAHHKIAAMAEASRAKRLMAFSLGETRVIVTCNPEVAKEMLNSSDFADRPIKESAYRLMFNRAIGFAPYGVYWRTLRKIAATHLFCPKQIKASEAQRSHIANQMVQLLMRKGDTSSGSIRVRDLLKLASLSNMLCSVFGPSYGLNLLLDSSESADESPREKEEDVDVVRELVDEGYQLLGIFNWSDHLPWLADFDLQKVRFRCSRLVPKVNHFVSRIIDHHRTSVPEFQSLTPHHHRAFVDVILNLQGPDKLSDSDMIAVLWEMIFRGTDTVAVLVEWILARMVLHPEVQSRVQQELDRVIGNGGICSSRAFLTESDITEVAYLPAVVKEVLRLHPPGPLLSWARSAIVDTTVDRCHVPMGTTAMVNMWAITRDPHVWSDPLSFKPERFLKEEEAAGAGDGGGGDFSVFGTDLRLAPFGSGRRTCPGKTLGLTTVTYWVAALLHQFEFLPADEDVEDGPDLSEVLRLSCEMANPLSVRVRARRTCG